MLIGLLLIAAAAASALLAASALRLPSLVSTLLAAYLAYVANTELATLALSPFREVRQGGLAAAELVLLGCATWAWWRRGRPLPPLRAGRAALRELLSDPVTGLFFLAVLAVLAYEILLASAPPNNMDSLTYHLAKAAAWRQHGGYYWIPNAPEVEINEYQPLAEQQVLFLFAATGSSALYALPQFLAELAVLVAVYGSSRRLGFERRLAACSAFLVATFSIFALEAVTGQVDLVAASFPAVAACLLLSGGRVEAAFAGAAIAFGFGTKLTTALVLPILLWLLLLRGRRILVAALVGGAAGFLAIGIWGYVLNTIHTGHPLGLGTGPVQFRGSPSYPGSVANAFYLMYGTMDLSVLSNRLIYGLAALGGAAALGLGGWALLRRRAGPGRALLEATGIATPLLAPLLVMGGAAVVAFIARRFGFPIRGPGGILGPLDENLNETYTRFANEDYSAYGPLGIVALLAAALAAVYAFARRRADARQLALACTLPVFLIFISLESTWHVFLIRFFLLPAALSAPLLARLLRGRATMAAYAAVGTLAIALTLTHDQPKPLHNPYGYGYPWNLTQVTALYTDSWWYQAVALTSYDEYVPSHACVGAVLGDSEPSFLLFGPHFRHRVFYLSVDDALTEAYRDNLSYVVISDAENRWAAKAFEQGGWRVRQLGRQPDVFWLLATAPDAGDGSCG